MIRDFVSGVGMVGCAFILLAALVFGGGALYILYLNTLGVQQMDAERRVVTQSRQYVQTQQQVLLNLYSDWVAATDEAHKNGARIQVCAQSAMLQPVDWPPQVVAFIQQNCR